MRFQLKIPILMMILAVCFLGTAISIRKYISPNNVLNFESRVLENNLHQKENLVWGFLNSETNISNATKFSDNYKLASDFLEKFDKTHHIHLLVYHHQDLDFWSSYLAANLPPIDFKEGTSFQKLRNGWYEIIVKRYKNYKLVFLINVKSDFSYQNQYLVNEINPELIQKSNLNIADITDQHYVSIHSVKGDYLFSLKLSNSSNNNFFTRLSLICCLFGIFCLCYLIQSFCSVVARSGYYWTSILILAGVLFVFRWSDWEFGWLNRKYNVMLFDPKIYAQSYFLPSLGDFLLNSIFIAWLAVFAFQLRYLCRLPAWLVKRSWLGYVFLIALISVIFYTAWRMDDVFFGLIENSKINLRVADILSMNMLSVVCIVILCLVWMSYYLLITFGLEMLKQCELSFRTTSVLFLTFVMLLSLYYLVFWDYTIFHLVLSIVIGVRGYQVLVHNDKFSVVWIVFILFCLALNTSIKYDRYNRIKERNTRLFLAQKLEKKDLNVIYAITVLEKELEKDRFIADFFSETNVSMHSALQNYILKKYLSGYLAKFEFNLYEYDSFEGQGTGTNQIILEKYRALVKSGSSKLSGSDFFYEQNDTFGYQVFFGLVPIPHQFSSDGKSSLLLLELKSKPIGNVGQLPDILVEGKAKVDEEFKEYSVGFFKNGNLVSQIGKYSYPLKNKTYLSLDKNITVILDDGSGYGHVIYKSNNKDVIVITRKLNSFMEALATLSFYFLVFSLFLVLVLFVVYISEIIKNHRFNWITFNRRMVLNANRVLYKTRIQVSMVLAVVTTLLIVGWITFYYVSKEYRQQQRQDMIDKISSTISNFQKQFINENEAFTNNQSLIDFNYFAEINGVDVILYNSNGDLELSTLPKLYEEGIVMRKMDALSYISMNDLNRSLFINQEERIGDYQFATAYAPILDENNITLGYLGIPFFNNEVQYKDKINLFINTLVNVYALVFVAIGFLAVAIANQITAPLSMIQARLRETQIGQSNKPIKWRRQDEIGALIKEYNGMIAALEDNAKKLALSERENAWREMAKQVAHEIKNPLTPLKLGIQLLERSWKSGDERFPQKFERFSASFIEQIESLSRIATEFSDFAKMPQTHLVQIDLVSIISQAVAVYQNMEKVRIVFHSDIDEAGMIGDKDQMLRVFNNLLKNAIEAKRDHSPLHIRIHLHLIDSFLHIQVQDNGTGIPPAIQSQIFTPNFTTKSSGTGLGLAFVRQAIENCGGTISFQTFINEGTTFFIKIPVKKV